MAKTLKDEIEEIKKLDPETRIARLKIIEKKIKEEKEKQEKEIAKLTKISQKEIIEEKEDEEKELSELLKEEKSKYKDWLENKVNKEEIKKEEEEVHNIEYGTKINEIKDIQKEIYDLSQTDAWGKEETNRAYRVKKKIDEIEQYKGVMSKYASDQVDLSKKTLSAIKKYNS